MYLELPNVTLIIVDCVSLDRAIKSLQHCQQKIKFNSCKILSTIKSDFDFVHKIDSINNLQEYSQFIIKKLDNYFDTDFVLVAQWDGFVWNPELWTNDFLQYDYIGAPWDEQNLIENIPKNFRVGNGGFSLRSKKLQNFIKENSKFITSRKGKFFPWDYIYPEDVAIGQVNRAYLESNGFKFPPIWLAELFSWENGPERKSFGHHGRILI